MIWMKLYPDEWDQIKAQNLKKMLKAAGIQFITNHCTPVPNTTCPYSND